MTRHWTVPLKYPKAGVNHANRTNYKSKQHYETKTVKNWRAEARTALRDAGMRPLRGAYHFVIVETYVWTCGADVDASLKTVVDCVAQVLNIDDKWVGIAPPHKQFVRHFKDQALVADITVIPLPATNDDEAKLQFNAEAQNRALWPDNPQVPA
jgi:hypothetical protein